MIHFSLPPKHVTIWKSSVMACMLKTLYGRPPSPAFVNAVPTTSLTPLKTIVDLRSLLLRGSYRLSEEQTDALSSLHVHPSRTWACQGNL